jgi:DUF4097 and DUF4098 domain-containing protein YvlB
VIDDMVGDLDVNTVNGEISVSDQEGVLSAHTVTGDITVTGALRKFSADGVSGAVFLDLTGTPEEISNNTVSGDLTIRLDEGIPARYSLNSVSGTLQIDSTITRGTHGRGFNHSTGSADEKRVEVRANSVSGDITSVRRVPVGAQGVQDAPVHDEGDFGSAEGDSL